MGRLSMAFTDTRRACRRVFSDLRSIILPPKSADVVNNSFAGFVDWSLCSFRPDIADVQPVRLVIAVRQYHGIRDVK